MYCRKRLRVVQQERHIRLPAAPRARTSKQIKSLDSCPQASHDHTLQTRRSDRCSAHLGAIISAPHRAHSFMQRSIQSLRGVG
jgi:hypothetical protein